MWIKSKQRNFTFQPYMHSACHRKCLVQKFPSYFEHCKLRWKYCHLCEWDFDALHSLIVYTNTSNMTCIIHSTLVIFYSHWSIPKNVLSSLSWSNWKTFRKSRLKFFLFKTKENNKAYTVKILVHLNLPVQICSSIPWGYMYLLNVAVLSYLLRVLVSTEGYCWASEFFSCLCHIHVNTVRFHWWSVLYKWSVADESAMCCINWFIELRGKDLLFMFVEHDNTMNYVINLI